MRRRPTDQESSQHASAEMAKAHLILEAKRGWEVETEGKLVAYATRFEGDTAREAAIAVVS